MAFKTLRSRVPADFITVAVNGQRLGVGANDDGLPGVIHLLARRRVGAAHVLAPPQKPRKRFGGFKPPQGVQRQAQEDKHKPS